MKINGKNDTRREMRSIEPSVQGEKTIHGRITTNQNVGGKLNGTSALSGNIDSDVNNRLLKDYNILINKPQINGVTLQGNKISEELGIPRLYYDTTANFNSDPSRITEEKAIYVYCDYQKDEDDNDIPGIKIGDGKGYLIDAPFIDTLYAEHIMDRIIHITQEERMFWNDKVRCYIDFNDDIENLIFTTN